MKWLIGTLVLANTIYTAYSSLCNTCSPTMGLACVDNTTFKICADGMPSPPAINCPSGTVCSLSTSQICIPDAPGVEHACSDCGTCNEDLTFACTTYNTFQLCLGTNQPKTEKYTCPNDLVCNIDTPTICVSKDSGIGSTCPWKTMTTPAPPTNTNTTTTPDEICKAAGVRGRYEVTSDLTCSKFVSCSQSGTPPAWTGTVYVCPTNRYFNPVTQLCGADKPKRCTSQPDPEPTEQTDEICD